MCGRYAASRKPEDLVEVFEVDTAAPVPRLEPSWNVAPTDTVYAVLERPPHPGDPGGAPEATGPGGPEDADAPRRQLRALRWGLVPSWAKDPSIGSRLINARAETVADKPAFRRAFSSRRCLLPADGYYEWYAPAAAAGGGKGRAPKQPFFLSPPDGGVLAMAGLYELWRPPVDPEDPDAEREWLWSATVLTTRAQDELGHIHDRMPMLVERSGWDAWLDPARSDPEELQGLLVPAAPGRLEARPVSTRVNSVRNDGPDLVEPLPVEPPEPAPAPLAEDRPTGRAVRGDDATLF